MTPEQHSAPVELLHIPPGVTVTPYGRDRRPVMPGWFVRLWLSGKWRACADNLREGLAHG